MNQHTTLNYQSLSQNFVHFYSYPLLKSRHVQQIGKLVGRQALLGPHFAQDFPQLDLELLPFFLGASFLEFHEPSGQDFHEVLGSPLGHYSLLVVECLEKRSHGLKIGLPQRDLDIELLECGNVHEVLAEPVGLAEGIGLELEVAAGLGDVGGNGKENGVVEDALSLEAGILVDVHSVECGQVNGGLQVGDYGPQDAQSGVDSEDVLEGSLVFGAVDGLNLPRRGATLFSSHMAVGTRSRISMWEEQTFPMRVACILCEFLNFSCSSCRGTAGLTMIFLLKLPKSIISSAIQLC